jgi:hypothetical protein
MYTTTRPNKLSSNPIVLRKIKKGIDNTIGGIILCEMKKKVISLFLTNPALKVNLDSA